MRMLSPGNERLESPWPALGLRDAFWRVQAAGFNAVDHTRVIESSRVQTIALCSQPGSIIAWGPGVTVQRGPLGAELAHARMFPFNFLVRAQTGTKEEASTGLAELDEHDFNRNSLVERLSRIGIAERLHAPDLQEASDRLQARLDSGGGVEEIAAAAAPFSPSELRLLALNISSAHRAGDRVLAEYLTKLRDLAERRLPS